MKLKIKLLKFTKKAFRKLLDGWYFTMKPVAYIYIKLEDYKYKKLVDKCKNMSDEELIKRYVKYLIKYMIRYGKIEREFVIFTKRGNKYEDDEKRTILLAELRNVGWDCKDEYLRSWRYYNDKADLWWDYKDNDSQMAEANTKLIILLKSELDRLGVKTDYKDARLGEWRNKGETWDSYGNWLDKIDYQTSLHIYL